MTATLQWHGHAALPSSAHAGTDSTLFTVPSGSYGFKPVFFAAIGALGSTSSSQDFELTVHYNSGGSEVLVGGSGTWGPAGTSGDLFVGTCHFSLTGDADSGFTVSCHVTGPLAVDPPIAMIGAALVSTDGGSSLFFGDHQDRGLAFSGGSSVGYTGSVTEPAFGPYTAGAQHYDIYPEGAIALVGGLLSSSTTLPTWTGTTGWSNIESAITSDGRGLGQAFAVLGWYGLSIANSTTVHASLSSWTSAVFQQVSAYVVEDFVLLGVGLSWGLIIGD